MAGLVWELIKAGVGFVPRKVWLGLGLLVFGLLVFGGVKWGVEKLVQYRTELAQQSIVVEELNQSLATLHDSIAKDANLVAEVMQDNERLTASGRVLENKLKKTMQNETTLDFDTLLSRDTSLAFCLRYQNARDQGNKRTAAKGVNAGKADTLATKCAEWQLTLGDIFEWTGLLLDHAGLESRDKAGLREWAGQE